MTTFTGFFRSLIQLPQKNTGILTVSMEQVPSWKANSSSASQKNSPSLFYETQKFITGSQKPASSPCPEPDQSSPHPPNRIP
jgi:hypothetical protein